MIKFLIYFFTNKKYQNYIEILQQDMYNKRGTYLLYIYSFLNMINDNKLIEYQLKLNVIRLISVLLSSYHPTSKVINILIYKKKKKIYLTLMMMINI